VLLFNNGDQHVSGYGAQDLRLHYILAVAKETINAQVLLDPFEEQFHFRFSFNLNSLPCLFNLPLQQQNATMRSSYSLRYGEHNFLI
jgi:hypothetical protein